MSTAYVDGLLSEFVKQGFIDKDTSISVMDNLTKSGKINNIKPMRKEAQLQAIPWIARLLGRKAVQTAEQIGVKNLAKGVSNFTGTQSAAKSPGLFSRLFGRGAGAPPSTPLTPAGVGAQSAGNFSRSTTGVKPDPFTPGTTVPPNVNQNPSAAGNSNWNTYTTGNPAATASEGARTGSGNINKGDFKRGPLNRFWRRNKGQLPTNVALGLGMGTAGYMLAPDDRG